MSLWLRFAEFTFELIFLCCYKLHICLGFLGDFRLDCGGLLVVRVYLVVFVFFY